MSDPTNQATTVRETLNREAQAIRQRTELTPAAKRAKIAALFIRATTDMDAVAEAAHADRAHVKARLTDEAFGTRGLVGAAGDRASLGISARDAADRAARLADPREALELLSNAHDRGDEVLAREIARRAHSLSASPLGASAWPPVLEQYAKDRPRQAQALNALTELGPDPTPVDDAFQWTLPVPSEIARLSGDAIARLATDPVQAERVPEPAWRRAQSR